MNADEDRVLLRILDTNPLIQRDEDVRRARHHCFHLRFAQLAVETLSHVERDQFFWGAVTPIRAAIFAAVPGVHYHGGKGFGGIFDRACWRRGASTQKNQGTDGDRTVNQTQHCEQIAASLLSGKNFALAEAAGSIPEAGRYFGRCMEKALVF